MVIVHSTKPRRSKTSEIIEIEGLSFFLKNSKSATLGNCEIYLAIEPYMLLKVSTSNEKAKLWISNNITRIKAKLATIGSIETITREEYLKPKEKEIIEVDRITLEDCQAMQDNIIKELKSGMGV